MRRSKYIGQAAYGASDLFVEVELRRPVCGKSVADRSYFHPDVAVVRNASAAAGAKGVDPSQYTFRDGVDDGREMPPYARPDMDIVELTQYAKRQSEVAEAELLRAKNARDFEKYREELAKEKASSSSVDNSKNDN